MGAIGGVLIADYWILRRRQLSLGDLFKAQRPLQLFERRQPARDHRARRRRAARHSRLPPRRHHTRAASCQSGLLGHALHLRLVRYVRVERGGVVGLLRRGAGEWIGEGGGGKLWSNEANGGNEEDKLPSDQALDSLLRFSIPIPSRHSNQSAPQTQCPND